MAKFDLSKKSQFISPGVPPVMGSTLSTPTTGTKFKTPSYRPVTESGTTEDGQAFTRIGLQPIDRTAGVEAAVSDIPVSPKYKMPVTASQEVTTLPTAETTKAVTTEGKAVTTEPTGRISEKYESGGDPGVISTGAGDIGGKSYGAYQFSSKTGGLNGFLGWLRGSNPQMYKRLMTGNFDSQWKAIAKEDSNGFKNIQKQYIMNAYYMPAAEALKKAGFDISGHSQALMDVLWSTAVQHGVGGAINLFKRIGFNGTDADIINRLYDERSNVKKYFGGNSESVQRGVYNRFKQERQDALNALAKGGTSTEATMGYTTGIPKVLQQETPTEAYKVGTYMASPESVKTFETPGETTSVTAPTTTAVTAPVTEPTTTVTPSVTQGELPVTSEKTLMAAPGATIRKGAKGDDVTKLQKALKALGYNITVDGIFGAETDAIVRQYQKKMGLTADGIVGSQTQAKLYGAGTTTPTTTTATHPDDNIDFTAEIEKRRAVNPNDPEIRGLEKRKAAKILRNKNKYSKEMQDWAIDMDRDGWKVEDYKNNYQAEIDRIKAFNPTDPRIQELQDARNQKIVSNPGGYTQAQVDEARKQVEERRYQIEQQQVAQSYLEAESQTDINKQKAIKNIQDYYQKVGLEAGGTAMSALAEAEAAGITAQAGLEKERTAKMAELTAQQEAQRAADKINELNAKLTEAKTQAEIDQINYEREQAKAAYSEATTKKSTAAAGGSTGGYSGGTTTKAAVTDTKTQNANYQSIMSDIDTNSPADELEVVINRRSDIINEIGASNYDKLVKYLTDERNKKRNSIMASFMGKHGQDIAKLIGYSGYNYDYYTRSMGKAFVNKLRAWGEKHWWNGLTEADIQSIWD